MSRRAKALAVVEAPLATSRRTVTLHEGWLEDRARELESLRPHLLQLHVFLASQGDLRSIEERSAVHDLAAVSARVLALIDVIGSHAQGIGAGVVALGSAEVSR